LVDLLHCNILRHVPQAKRARNRAGSVERKTELRNCSNKYKKSFIDFFAQMPENEEHRRQKSGFRAFTPPNFLKQPEDTS